MSDSQTATHPLLVQCGLQMLDLNDIFRVKLEPREICDRSSHRELRPFKCSVFTYLQHPTLTITHKTFADPRYSTHAQTIFRLEEAVLLWRWMQERARNHNIGTGIAFTQRQVVELQAQRPPFRYAIEVRSAYDVAGSVDEFARKIWRELFGADLPAEQKLRFRVDGAEIPSSHPLVRTGPGEYQSGGWQCGNFWIDCQWSGPWANLDE